MADLSLIRSGARMTFRQQLSLTARLSVPAILAQLSTIMMQYIDASMVGRLSVEQSASVGLMNSSLWLFWGVCSTVTMGFSVQVAHSLGGGRQSEARDILRQGLTVCLLFGVFMALLGTAISPWLPAWLGGSPEIRHDATVYFMTFVLALPMLILNYLAGGMLRCAGNMKIPGLLNVGMCVLDVFFNFFLIFPTRDVVVCGMPMTLPGAGLGVFGAALGTAGAECVCASAMLYYLLRRQPDLCLTGAHRRGSFRPTRRVLAKASKIAVPMTLEHIIFCGAQIMITVIVAPLKGVAIAANAFAVTAESLCYMPGFGIGEAATTLAGQSYGAGRYDLVRRFCHITVGLGAVVMTVMGVIMYVAAPFMMDVMTDIESISSLGAECLRIEALAEPMYAVSIVAYGAFVGVGDTMIPAIMNFGSIWMVRIPLAAVLAPTMGLIGVWVAMCIELVFRGLIFLWRMYSGAWLRHDRKKTEPVQSFGFPEE